MEIISLYYKEESFPAAYKFKNIFDNISYSIIHDLYYQTQMRVEARRDVINIKYDNDECKTYFTGNDPIGISIIDRLTPIVSKTLGKEILPSYTYTRVYEGGTRLIPHRDKNACEVSMSITIYNDPDNKKIENFYISRERDETKGYKIEISTGDGLLFFGAEELDGFYHWRDKTDSNYLMQIFLHWVYKDGNNTSEAYSWKK